jgi:hypothetical protein
MGMQAFVKMERKLLSWMLLKSYCDTGAQAIKSLGTAMAGNKPVTEYSSIVFLSLDFEGNRHRSKISEIGMAKLDSRQLLSANGSGITSLNFALAKHRNRKFMFGNTTRLYPQIMGKTLVELFRELNHEDSQREIILVSHGTTSEIRVLDEIGVPLETLPVTGIINTCCLAGDALGSSGTLWSLITTLRFPARRDLLHCAGNDAHYALQVLLALLQTRYFDNFEQLERLARQEPPLQPCYFAKKTSDDWTDHPELDANMSLPLD